ncbi:MAG: DUF3298 and DUF4163 domain-containing protein [Fimbriimonadaceae bacterium]|nr:DUF3298 and DUF4163 domain-containing protein [Fimbriimonadaceae bacterium]
MISAIFSLTVSLHSTPPTIWKDQGTKWEVSLAYTPLDGKTPFAQSVNSELRAWLRPKFEEAVADAMGVGAELHETRSEASASSEATVGMTFYNQNLASFIVSTYSYMGGAHPNTFYDTATFSNRQNRAVKIRARELFRTGVNVRKTVSDLVIPELRRKKASSVLDGSIRQLPDELLERFTISSTGITWHFAPYSVASYAEGSFEVSIPWSRLRSSLNPSGPLRGIMQ